MRSSWGDHVTVLIEVVGWAGAALLLTAYALVSAERLAGGGWLFQVMNLAGGLGLAVNSAARGAWPSVGLNVVWIVVGLGTLARSRRPVVAPSERPPSAA